MKKLSFILAALVFAATGARAQPGLTARIHFAGADHIAAAPAHLAFTNEFSSPEAKALEAQTLNKLSHLPDVWLKGKLAPGALDSAAQLRPLLNDFLTAEWIFEMRDASGRPEYALAIRLEPNRAQYWSKILTMVLKRWTGTEAVPDKSGGWEVSRRQWPGVFQFSRSGAWVVIDWGVDKLTLRDEILPAAGKSAAAEGNWLSADLDWPRLAQVFPALKQFDFPKIQMVVTGAGGKLQFNGKFTLAQPFPALPKWQLPTKAIRGPLVSFTAARGIAPWLERHSWTRPFTIQPQPDQLFIWALPGVPFQTFAAEPVPNARTAIGQLYQHLSADNRWRKEINNPITLFLTNNVISFRDVPFMTPRIWTDNETAGDFLVGGFFPNSPKPAPFPPALMSHLEQPKVVYYHWEFTPQRLKDLPQLSQLVLLLTRHRQLGGKSVAAKWLDQIGPTLGNSTTEITQIAPDKLKFHRVSRGGLTAIELLALANWLESPDFPSFNLKLPPPHFPPAFHRGQKPFGRDSRPPRPAR